jgi:mycothiol synthase
MLRIRQFLRGRDEGLWLEILNRAFGEYEDFRPWTMNDFRGWKSSPYFNAEGMFIAEVNGKPVGIVEAYIDRKEQEKKGFIRWLSVIPEFRGLGVGKALLERAIERLRDAGMEYAEAVVRKGKMECESLFESYGFKVVRTFSGMERDLYDIPSNIGENLNVKIREVAKTNEDIRIYNKLHNEAFKEHYNFRPETIEETEFWIKQNPWFDIAGHFLAYLDNNPVGFVGVGVDKTFNERHQKKRGWILTIGVIQPYRRKGIGTALMLHAMRYLKSLGMEEAALTVDDSNPTKAIQLYKKVGFVTKRTELVYQKKLK